MSSTTARSPSDPLDGQCMLTAVLRQCSTSSVRLSTAVQGDIPSTMHNLVMLIAAVHQSSCAVSVQTCGRCSIKRQSVAAAHRRVWSWCAERLSELAHATRKTDNGRLWLPAAHARRPEHQSRGSGRLKRCAAAYIVKLTLVLQKRYFVDHLRLQIVFYFPHKNLTVEV